MATITPPAGAYVITQGDTLPLMRIPLAENAAGELIDLSGCTVTFMGRVANSAAAPAPVIRLIESYAEEVATADDATALGITEGDSIIAVYVHFAAADTQTIAVARGQHFVEMEGELEVVDANGDVLTVWGDDTSDPNLVWYVRDDIGASA